MNNTVTLKFETAEQAKDFVIWMSEDGEQHHWQHAEDADIDKLIFKYDYLENIITATKR